MIESLFLLLLDAGLSGVTLSPNAASAPVTAAADTLAAAAGLAPVAAAVPAAAPADGLAGAATLTPAAASVPAAAPAGTLGIGGVLSPAAAGVPVSAPADTLTAAAGLGPATAAAPAAAPADTLGAAAALAAAPAGAGAAATPATLTAATAAGAPVTVDQLRAQVRVEDTIDDVVLAGYLAAAADHIAGIVGQPLTATSTTLTFEQWPCGGWPVVSPWSTLGWSRYGRRDDGLRLPLPVTSVDAIAYTDPTGAQVPWTAGAWIARVSRGGVTHVRPASGQPWPELGPDPLITVTVSTGFASLPPAVAQAQLMLAAHFYLNREEVLTGARITAIQVPIGVDALLARYRWKWIG